MLAPSFGHNDSKLLVEAFQSRSHQHSLQVKPFSEAPKEVPTRVATTTGFSVHEFQTESDYNETKRYSPCFDARSTPEVHPNDSISSHSVISPSSSNGTYQSTTPRASLRLQAYVALKASPNVSAYGNALHFLFLLLQFTFSCRNWNVPLSTSRVVARPASFVAKVPSTQI